MTTFSLNCRGLRDNLTVRRLKEMCREHFPNFLFLIENKNSSDHISSFQGSLGYDHHFLVNPVGLSGGLALFWRSSHEVEIFLQADNRLIETKVKIRSITFFIFCLWWSSKESARAGLGQNKDIGASRDVGWFLVGDFNDIMNNKEKIGGPIRPVSSFYSFRSFVRDCKLKETPNFRNKISWAGLSEVLDSNGEIQNVWIQWKLDKAFGNAEWLRFFPRIYTKYLNWIKSDNRPILTRLVTGN